MMAIVMQNTAVCRVAEASLRTVRALRRPQRALQRPLRHAQSLPFPSLSPSSGGRLRKLFKNPCSQAELNKIVPFGFSLQRQKMVFFLPSK